MNRTDTLSPCSLRAYIQGQETENKQDKKAPLVWMWQATGREDARQSEQLGIWCHLLKEEGNKCIERLWIK